MTADSIELDNLVAGDDVDTDLISSKHIQYVKLKDGTIGGTDVVHTGNGTATNALRVTSADAAVDSNNSTTSTLTANSDYAGTYTDVSSYAGITVSIFADQNSDAAGMKFIFSSDGTNDDIDIAGGFDYLASTGRTFQFPIKAQFFRVQFNNAGTGQGAFRLETLLHKSPVSLTSMHRIDADVVPDRSAELVKAALVARKAGAGDFVPIQSTTGGNLKVSIEEDGSGTLALAANQLPDGHAVTVDNASGASAVNIQDGGNSITVDNGGTFAVQATLDAETTKVIGTVNIAAGQSVTADLGANNDVIAAGDIAHDTADSGNPVKVGGKAKAFDGTAPGTDVAENDRVDAAYTVWGAQFVETTHPNYWSASADYASAQTNATVKAAPGAGLKLYITDIIVSNGATAGNITLLDGSGGTVLLELYPAINGGLTHSFRTPIALTANTLLAITSTTVTTHSVTVSGYTAA